MTKRNRKISCCWSKKIIHWRTKRGQFIRKVRKVPFEGFDLFDNDTKASTCKEYWNLSVEGLCHTAISYMKSETGAFTLGECFFIIFFFASLVSFHMAKSDCVTINSRRGRALGVFNRAKARKIYTFKPHLIRVLWGKQGRKCFCFWKVCESPPFYLFFKWRMKWAISRV